MSRLRGFVEGAASVAAVQEQILNAMESVFSTDGYAALEAAILAPGLDGWEGRALHLIKTAVSENFSNLNTEIAALTARYKSSVPVPGQEQEFWVDPLRSPHLRVYLCLRCGFRVISLALSGICCHGQPECPRCKHQVHEDNCRRKGPRTVMEQA